MGDDPLPRSLIIKKMPFSVVKEKLNPSWPRFVKCLLLVVAEQALVPTWQPHNRGLGFPTRFNFAAANVKGWALCPSQCVTPSTWLYRT